MVEAGVYQVYLDMVIRSGKSIVALSVFDGSLQRIKAFCALMNLQWGSVSIEGEAIVTQDKYNVYVTTITAGKEKFYHALLVNSGLHEKFVITTQDHAGESFYDWLMESFSLPLLKWWGKPLLNEAIERGKIVPPSTRVLYGEESCMGERKFAGVKLDELMIYDVSLYCEEDLKVDIESLFQRGELWISDRWQEPLKIRSIDDYFTRYGSGIVDNMKTFIKPLTELIGTCDNLVLRNKRLFPQQCAMVNGVCNLLKVKSSALLVEGMGCGKSIQAASICEMFFVQRYLKQHKNETLADVYSVYDKIKYRNIIMCPGHLVEKWEREISEEIPYAKTEILHDLSQLIELEKHGAKREQREFYVISKELAKLSYLSRPVPVKIKYRTLKKKTCGICETEFLTPGNVCPKCQSQEYWLQDTGIMRKGLVCPECGELLLEYHGYGDIENAQALMPKNFTNPNTYNSQCYYCNAMMWQPCINNIDQVNLRKKKIHSPWYRATHYANKAHKATKTVWVHRMYADEYFAEIDEIPVKIHDDIQGSRKVSLALYIKKKMKNFFDFSIFDEAHLYKGGGSGQAWAMHALINSSKWHLALTGTIAGGMAQDLFYLLFRLMPGHMIEKGFQWGDVMKFNEKYGTLEREFELISNGGSEARNKVCRGKQVGTTVVKPGISPLIFVDFLLQNAVFLDITDLSKYLPPLKEYVVEVHGDESTQKIEFAYERVIQKIKSMTREKGGKKLLGKLLQFSLSYPDKPFRESEIIHPLDGSVICECPQFPEVWEGDFLLPKERKLIEILKRELDEGRDCVVFAEYTSSPETCVSYRLLDLIESRLGVHGVVLEASSPEPYAREQWIHDKAEIDKCRVIICNPKCIETGLDLCWETDHIYYTFPTLIFYQMGYSLYTIWQASRRHYRLNQRVECRTYYLCLAGTIQREVIRIIAEKQVATSAIQGKFSAEGLAAMANGVDMKVRLAQALSEHDDSSNDLQEMFDILSASQEGEDEFEGIEKMPILSELIGEEHLKAIDEILSNEIDIEALIEELFDFDDDGDETIIQQSYVENVEPETVISSMMNFDNFMSLFQ